MSDPCLRLVDRLRGIYTIPVNDGSGLLNGKDTFTPAEPFFTPPVQKEAAERIERLEAELEMYREAAMYDACMSGPIFKGWNRSALDRARRVTEERTRRESRG